MILAEVLQLLRCRAGSTGADAAFSSSLQTPHPTTEESGHVAAHGAGFSLENKNENKPPLR